MSKIFHMGWLSPVGVLHLYADEDSLLALAFNENRAMLERRLGLTDAEEGSSPPIASAVAQLEEYFAGKRKDFNLPLTLRGTDFQRLAWEALKNIPYGSCESYTSQALAIGKEGAVRAVGAANGKNPYSIVLPCHRVIGKSGRLTGYAGGEKVKEALLKLEGYMR